MLAVSSVCLCWFILSQVLFIRCRLIVFRYTFGSLWTEFQVGKATSIYVGALITGIKDFTYGRLQTWQHHLFSEFLQCLGYSDFCATFVNRDNRNKRSVMDNTSLTQGSSKFVCDHAVIKYFTQIETLKTLLLNFLAALFARRKKIPRWFSISKSIQHFIWS